MEKLKSQLKLQAGVVWGTAPRRGLARPAIVTALTSILLLLIQITALTVAITPTATYEFRIQWRVLPYHPPAGDQT